ncbi:MAG: helix-turn-helix domain-containing protein [Thermoleophilaceae bacterium]
MTEDDDPADPDVEHPLSEPLLDPAGAAALLSVRRSWVYEAVRDGRLPHVKVGRHVRFLREDLERWVFAQRKGRLF